MGLDLAIAYRNGWFVIIVSIFLTVIAWVWGYFSMGAFVVSLRSPWGKLEIRLCERGAAHWWAQRIAPLPLFHLSYGLLPRLPRWPGRITSHSAIGLQHPLYQFCWSF